MLNPLLVLGLLELITFALMVHWLGFGLTLLLLILSMALGSMLIREAGLQATIQRIQRLHRQEETQAVAFNSLVLLAGLLFLIPGFITDLLGLLCLLPQIKRWLAQRYAAPNAVQGAGQGQTIEGEYQRKDES